MASPLTGTSAPPLIVTPGGVTPQNAARAYQDIDAGGGSAAPGADFGSVLWRSVEGSVNAGHAAENQAVAAVAGGGDLTEVVQAVTRAELALQVTTAIRDRVVSAYQDIMRMPI
jgi:flagellar hook-basal body complex protein FliE